MNETMKMLQALGLYVLCAKNGGKSKADCFAAQDYHSFLAEYEAQAVGLKGFFGFNEGNPLLPLADITLTVNEYCDIVRQIYDQGITQMNALNLPYPAVAAPAVAHGATTYFDNYLRTLGNDPRTPADVNSTIGRINELMMHKTGTSPRVAGLVVGRVQSGKTRNYVGLALKAIDEGWNTIIVLTSCSTALADQTEERILDDFKKSGLIRGPHFERLNFRDSTPVMEPAALGQADYIYVGVAMKQRDNLDHILKWLGDYPERVRHMRLLLIDDEADNATPDSNSGRENQLDDEDIDELVDATAEEDDGVYSDLSDWISNVRNSPRLTDEDGSPWKPVVSALRETLKHENARTFGEVLGNHNYLCLLGLDENAEVVQQIFDYFNGTRTRSPKYFLKLLNALLDVGVARSAINERICQLIALSESTGEYNYKFAKFAYVAYTATPYANILNERSDQTPLYPDFIKSLQEAPQYFGLDKIFGEDETVARPKMNIVNAIPSCEDGRTTRDEVRFVLRPLQRIKDFEPPRQVLAIEGPDVELNVRCSTPRWSGRWDTLRTAIAWLYCSAAARRWHRREVLARDLAIRQGMSDEEKTKKLNALEVRWTTMLMNISQIRDVHRLSKEMIDRLLAHCCSAAHAAAFRAECETCWGKMTRNFAKAEFDALFNSGNPADNYSAPGRPIRDYPSWQEIVGDVEYFIHGTVAASENAKTVHTIVVNSENVESKKNQDFYNQRRDAHGGRWDYTNTLADDQAWIMCGGNTISRGLTLLGLTSSYFDRVRKGATIDTLTQMGRWFGYRPGYELLPRIWMTQETVTEMKRICVTENRMHETMRENFDAGYSPSDPAHYQQVYYWGRRLSGRQRQLNLSGAPVGTTGITDDVSGLAADVQAVYSASQRFVGSLGTVQGRSQIDYQYYTVPFWAGVSKTGVMDFLGTVKDHYPESSKRKLASLVRELNASDVKLDVVIGEPARHNGCTFNLSSNIPPHAGLVGPGMIYSGSANPTRRDGIMHYSNLRTHTGFYAAITRVELNKTDVCMLKEEKRSVLAEIRNRVDANGGQLPVLFERAFADAGIADGSVEQRLNAYLAYCESHPGYAPAPCIRDCMSEGCRNRSSIEYYEKAYDIARRKDPVLQLYFVKPPDGEPQDKPYLSISFYWPKHAPSRYQMGTVSAPPPPGHPDEAEIYAALGEILRNNAFPMTSEKLKVALMQRYPAESESIYFMNVVEGQASGGYRRLRGKHAYYSLGWAGEEDPVEKIKREVLMAAVQVIRRQRRTFRSQEIVDIVLRENRRFEGVADLTTTILNQQMLTDEVLAEYDIAKVSGNPVAYKMN